MSKPSVFIGSSSEGKRIAKAANRILTDWAEPKLWTQGVFLPSRFPLEELERQLRICRFAVLVATPDDEVTKRGDVSLVMRDNVLFEFGMFAGLLGRRRVFLLVPDSPSIAVPSDLAGLTLAHTTSLDPNAKMTQRSRQPFRSRSIALKQLLRKSGERC